MALRAVFVGEPSWSYLYRYIPPIASAGYRAIAMDFIGAGRSDKPIDIDYCRYDKMSEQILEFIDQLDLDRVTLVVQDWGAYLGLRTVGLRPDRFDRVVLLNGQLPVIPEGLLPYEPVTDPDQDDDSLRPFYDGWPAQMEPFRNDAGELPVDMPFHEIFPTWMAYTMKSPTFVASETTEAMTWFPLSDRDRAACDAPFPTRRHMALPRMWPSMMLQVPGAAGQPHSTIDEAAHFLQDDQGEQLADRIVDFVQSTPRPAR